MASDTPADAITAAADAVERLPHRNAIGRGAAEWYARAAVAAAAPVIRAEEREACARLAEQEAQLMADEDEIVMSAGMMHVADLIRARTTP